MWDTGRGLGCPGHPPSWRNIRVKGRLGRTFFILKFVYLGPTGFGARTPLYTVCKHGSGKFLILWGFFYKSNIQRPEVLHWWKRVSSYLYGAIFIDLCWHQRPTVLDIHIHSTYFFNFKPSVSSVESLCKVMSQRAVCLMKILRRLQNTWVRLNW